MTRDELKDLLANLVECGPTAAADRLIQEILTQFDHDNAPIPMNLVCPNCGRKHIDKGELLTKPHRDHQCEFCLELFRPAEVNTVGVQKL